MIPTAVLSDIFWLLLLLIIINAAEIYSDLNYDLYHYNTQQRMNAPFSTENIETRPGFRLKARSSEQQSTEVSWLPTNPETSRQLSPPIVPYHRSLQLTRRQHTPVPSLSANPTNGYQQYYHYHGGQQGVGHSWLTTSTTTNQQSPTAVAPYSQSFYLSTEEPQVVPLSSPNHVSNYQQYHQYYGNFPTMYYATNFRTISPLYHNDYSSTVVQRTYPPVSTMVAAIRNILSILERTMYPNDNDDNDFNTTLDFSKNKNLTIKKPESTFPAILSPLSKLSLSTSTVTAGTGKLGEMDGTTTSGSNGDVETGQPVNAEPSKKTGIEKLNEMIKLANSMVQKISKKENITATAIVSEMPETMTTTTTTTSPSIDGSNLVGSLLNGHLDKVDWFGSLLGFNQLPTKEEGSALAQIFRGGIFGRGN